MQPFIGPVAQLNRVSDYGSEGSRFESWQGHKESKVRALSTDFFVSRENQARLSFRKGTKKKAAKGGWTLLSEFGSNQDLDENQSLRRFEEKS